MTGATVVIRRGTDFIMCKVRHDGMDSMEFFGRKNFFTLFPVFIEPGKEYLRPRYDPSNPFVADEIHTNFKEGFSCSLEKVDKIKSEKDFGDILNRIHCLIDEIDHDDGYLCGYEDHCIFVDYDNESVLDVRRMKYLVSPKKKKVVTTTDDSPAIFTAFL